jgi:hypothetical protein
LQNKPPIPKTFYNPESLVAGTGGISDVIEVINSDQELNDVDIYRLPGKNTEEYTAKLRIEYTNDRNPFGSKQFVIINI